MRALARQLRVQISDMHPSMSSPSIQQHVDTSLILANELQPCSRSPIRRAAHEAYTLALQAVCGEDTVAFRRCVEESPEVLRAVHLGWPLLHHIVLMDWQEGLEVYKEMHGCFDVRSEDYVQRLGSGTMHMSLFHCGGQTLLHVIAMNRPSCLAEMRSRYPHANVVDYNQRLPDYYAIHRDIPKDDQALIMTRIARDCIISFGQVAKQYRVDFDHRQPMEGVRCFSIPDQICSSLVREIAGLPRSIPNSMHQYGKILLPQMQEAIYSLVAGLLPAEDLTRVNRVHAFYIQYSDAVGQKSLGSHIDDSYWTINLCLAVSPELIGSELVFDDRFTHRHSQCGRGIIHRGCIRHHVLPLLSGYRENIIVWVGLAPKF